MADDERDYADKQNKPASLVEQLDNLVKKPAAKKK
jgi:hypothetical protein